MKVYAAMNFVGQSLSKYGNFGNFINTCNKKTD